jgi:DNA-binding transcriptional LysR family regulator
MDKLRAMSAFVQIVESGSLTAAANSVDSSLPAMVRLLAALEQELSVRLLNRTTRRMALTDEGREYYERCKRILADVEEAEETLLNSRGGAPHGRLHLTAPTTFGRMHIAPLARQFTQLHPGLSVDLLLVDRVVNLLDEGLDCGIRIGSLPDSSLVALRVTEVQRTLCASPTYLAEHGTPQHPKDLTQHACIRFSAMGPSHEWTLMEDGRKLTVPVSGPLSGNSADALIEACVADMGIGMFLSYQIAPWVAQGKLQVILQDFYPPPIPVSVIYPHAKLLPNRTRLFARWLQEQIPKRVPSIVSTNKGKS